MFMRMFKIKVNIDELGKLRQLGMGDEEKGLNAILDRYLSEPIDINARVSEFIEDNYKVTGLIQSKVKGSDLHRDYLDWLGVPPSKLKGFYFELNLIRDVMVKTGNGNFKWVYGVVKK